jgi:hypothetical protein
LVCQAAWSPQALGGQLGAPRATSATLRRDGTGALSFAAEYVLNNPGSVGKISGHEIGVTLEARHPLQHIFREADLAEFAQVRRTLLS